MIKGGKNCGEQNTGITKDIFMGKENIIRSIRIRTKKGITE